MRDGSVLFRPSGGAASRFAGSLRTANTGVGAEYAGAPFALPHAVGDGTVEDFHHGRELFGWVCEIILAIQDVLAEDEAEIEAKVEINKDEEPPASPIIININIEQNGNGKITIPIDSKYINDDGTDICDTCTIDIEAGDCVDNCEGYDQDATNAGLQASVFEVVGAPTSYDFED